MKFTVDIPNQIFYGRGIRARLPEFLAEGNALIICGAHAVARVRAEVVEKLTDREIVVVSGFPPEPDLKSVDQAVARAREISATTIVGYGGGSAMDGAKAVAALMNLPATTAEYFYGKVAPIECSRPRYVAIPTTAGTGAESTTNAVLRDDVTGIKQSLRLPNMGADVALVDPELVEDAPLKVLAGSGFDALTQSLESFISKKATTLTRELARAGAVSLWRGLWRLAKNERSAEVFDLLTYGSMVTGCAFGTSGLGAVHGLAHPLGSVGHLPHGVVCAILLPTVLEWNLTAVPEAMSELAVSLTGDADVGKWLRQLRALRRELLLPENFSSLRLSSADLDFVLRNCRSGSMRCNPRDLTDFDLIRLLTPLL